MDSTGRMTHAIIEDIRVKGDAGIEAFVRHFGPKLLAFVNYKLGDRLRTKVEAEDVLQDFFASIIENRTRLLEKVDDRGVHRTVFRMIEGRIKDLYEWHFKAQKRDAALEIHEHKTPSGAGGFSFSRVAASTASLSRKIEAIDEYNSLERILDQLEKEHKRLFVMKFIEEMTNQEMAEELGVSISTVKRQTSDLIQTIHRLRKQ